MKSQLSKSLIAIIAALLLVSTLSVRANFYQLDDGTAEDGIGLTGGNGADLIALNQFNVSGGNNLIGSVSIAWGAPPFPDPTLNGLSYTVAIWSDPNNDGNPNDAILLATAPDVIANAGTDTFITTLFPCVAVTPSFFVGFIITQGATQFPAAFDEDPPTFGGRSFVAGSITPGGGDITNLTNNDLPVDAVENYGLNGNFLIRADPWVVPEPSTAALGLVGGLMGAAVWRRKIARLLFRRHPSHNVATNLGGSIFVCSYGKAARRRVRRKTSELPSRRSFASRKPQIHLKHPA